MTDNPLEGAQIIIDEIDMELRKKQASTSRLLLRSHRYQLAAIGSLRGELETLKKHDVIGWAQAHPRASVFIVLGGLTLNSMVNWASVRKPILQAIIQFVTGVSIPLDSLP